MTCLKCLFKVSYYIINMFSANRYANIIRRYARGKLLLLIQLLMRRAGRMYHKRLAVADIGKMAGELDAVYEL